MAESLGLGRRLVQLTLSASPDVSGALAVHSSAPVAHLSSLGLDPVAGPRAPSPVLGVSRQNASPLGISLA